MKDNIFIDSNILVYLASKQDLKKRLRVREIINKNYENIIISIQVLGEVFSVLKGKTNLTSQEIAKITIKYSNEFFVVNIEKENFSKAIEIHFRYQYSFYDSLIIATALITDCSILYSEDMNHNQLIENKLRIINPFKKYNEEKKDIENGNFEVT